MSVMMKCSVCPEMAMGGIHPKCRGAEFGDMLLQIQKHAKESPNSPLPVQIIAWLKAREFAFRSVYASALRQIKRNLHGKEHEPLSKKTIKWLSAQKFRSLHEYLWSK